MENKIYPLIYDQLPEHIRESSPVFVEFLVTYYKYASLQKNSIGSIQQYTTNTDIDSASNDYISNFLLVYGEFFPQNIVLNKQNFIKLLNKIYEAKGTEKALKLVFRLLFNDNITISYPTKQILRASDGKWNQESFVTLSTKFGEIPKTPFVLRFSNNTGDYGVNVSRTFKLDVLNTRFYFKSFEKITVQDNQLANIYAEDSSVLYVGQLKKSPAKIIIEQAGREWRVGQVFSMAGSTLPTISRVSSIDNFGGVTGLEMIQYGYSHTDTQSLIISPYLNKPSSASIDISSRNVLGAVRYTVNIADSTENILDEVYGISSVKNENSYYLERYVDDNYAGDTVFSQKSNQGVSLSATIDTGLTIEDWMRSRATFNFSYDNIVKTKGSYVDDSGKLSNQETKLQDNYYYQVFSYVINTSKDISEYESILNITHPSGTKRFSNIVKEAKCVFNLSAKRTISSDNFYTLDIINSPSDSSYLNTCKKLTDSIDPVSDNGSVYKTLNKSVTDTIYVSSLDYTRVEKAGYDYDVYFNENYSSHDVKLLIG